MRLILCLLALMVSVPAAAQARGEAWSNAGRADYARPDYGSSGPAPAYYAPGAYVMYMAPGPHSYRYQNGVRVWYGSVPAFAPVLTTTAVVQQQPALAMPPSPGPRVYRAANGVRIWYGQ